MDWSESQCILSISRDRALFAVVTEGDTRQKAVTEAKVCRDTGDQLQVSESTRHVN